MMRNYRFLKIITQFLFCRICALIIFVFKGLDLHLLSKINTKNGGNFNSLRLDENKIGE
jgi:uncharacterized membrane protein